MQMSLRGIGVDILEIKRFDPFAKKRHDRFLTSNYSEEELTYCFSFKDPRPHLAGTFAAKEAVWKALGRSDILFREIEIKRTKLGRPTAWIANREQKSTLISISHTEQVAIAIAIKN